MSLHLPGPLLLVGAGKMGHAMLEGWLARGAPPQSIFVRDPAPNKKTAAMLVSSGVALGAPAFPPAVVVMAVKPDVLDTALDETRAGIRPETLVISIAAGKKLSDIESRLGDGAAIVRAMPNTPAAIGRGMTVACANARVSGEQTALCTALLEAFGDVAWIDDENQIDAVTAVSGSGPAYVFLLAECLAEAGIAEGLAPELARRLAGATVSGAGELLRQSGAPPDDLRRDVTSKGGTTEAALRALMQDDAFANLIRRAVEAAARRSRELG